MHSNLNNNSNNDSNDTTTYTTTTNNNNNNNNNNLVSHRSLGKPFQSFGAAMANDLSPNVILDLILRTCSK